MSPYYDAQFQLKW